MCSIVGWLPVAGSWTHFVKSTFAKYSGDRKKAPSASLARSIFVTWLNGVPYDKRDSPFLEEMKLSAAEYQTHSLAIANSHYDKDAASEAKLRVLVDFCDAYAQWQPADHKAGAAVDAGMSDNIDSDEEGEGPAGVAVADELLASASAPASPKASAEESPVAPVASIAAAETKQARPAAKPKTTTRRRRPTRRDSENSSSGDSDSDSSSSSADDSDDRDQHDADDAADDAEYMPDRIIAKKTVAWQDFYLIHWLGYTAAERTWEPAAFFDQWCTKQTYEYEQSRRPARILALTRRPLRRGDDGKAAAEQFFEVQWQGRSETSMEREQLMRDDFPEIVHAWEQREQARASRKQPRRDSGSDRPEEGEPPLKQARLS